MATFTGVPDQAGLHRDIGGHMGKETPCEQVYQTKEGGQRVQTGQGDRPHPAANLRIPLQATESTASDAVL